MIRFGRLLAVYLSAGAIALADDKIKNAVEDGRINNTVTDSPSLIKIEKHHNTGFAGNRLDDKQKLVASVSASASSVQACLTGYAALSGSSVLFNAANTLLLAGAISNTKDRITRRYVVDYLRINNRIYNLSDFCIFLGAILAVINAFTRNVQD